MVLPPSVEVMALAMRVSVLYAVVVNPALHWHLSQYVCSKGKCISVCVQFYEWKTEAGVYASMLQVLLLLLLVWCKHQHDKRSAGWGVQMNRDRTDLTEACIKTAAENPARLTHRSVRHRGEFSSQIKRIARSGKMENILLSSTVREMTWARPLCRWWTQAKR